MQDALEELEEIDDGDLADIGHVGDIADTGAILEDIAIGTDFTYATTVDIDIVVGTDFTHTTAVLIDVAIGTNLALATAIDVDVAIGTELTATRTIVEDIAIRTNLAKAAAIEVEVHGLTATAALRTGGLRTSLSSTGCSLEVALDLGFLPSGDLIGRNQNAVEGVGYEQRTDMSVERTDGGAKATGFQLGSLANDFVVADHLIGLGIELQRAKVGRLNGTIVADRTAFYGKFQTYYAI